MSKNKADKRIKWAVLGVILALITALGAVAAYTVFLHEPDNNNDTPPGFDTEGLLNAETASPETGEETQPTDTEEPKETEAPDEEDDKEYMYNFLILGRDRVALNTDVIMLMNFNVKTGKMAIMQLPRDTYLLIDNYGHKLNAVYGNFYNEGVAKKEKDPEDYGLNKLKTVLEQNLCLKIHYYAMVNLEGFRNIVDILGGVEVDIPADMDYIDNDQNLSIHLKKGKQVLNGEKAEMFVRFRSGYVQADIGRMDAQKIFMSALLKEVKDHLNLTNAVKIAKEVFDNIKTDVAVDDMVFFAKKLIGVDLSNMTMMTATGYSPAPPPGYVWFYVINREGTRQLINKHFNIYDFEITDSIFDKNRIFSGKYATYLTPYYNAAPENLIGGNEQSAEDIVGGAIDIPRT